MQTPTTPVMFTKPTDLRAPGAIDALLKFHHSVFGDMQMNGAAGGDAGGQGGDAGGAGGSGGDAGGQGGDAGGSGGSGGDAGGSDDGVDLGFPKDTPIKEMSAEQQAAYWKHLAQKHERAWQSKSLVDMTPDEVKALREENEELKRKTMSDSEKAIADARAEGERAGREAAAAEGKNNTLKLVDGYIDGFLNIQGAKREDHKDFLESLDLSKFITAEGDIDTDRVANVIGGALGNRPGTTQRWPDMGQGHRGGGAKTSGMDAGRAEAARRFEQNKQQSTGN
ncbi:MULTISPECIES: hypothetical protein [unclassified Aeromicrobium]|uniref:hypothetical protein n=1 Tax=unclassified Aeromicrobium TaxID=2633570 RepID=UPI00288A940F|nr:MULTISPECIES: hypothetical protein [unclassified Aeromicrobium]